MIGVIGWEDNAGAWFKIIRDPKLVNPEHWEVVGIGITPTQPGVFKAVIKIWIEHSEDSVSGRGAEIAADDLWPVDGSFGKHTDNGPQL